MTEFGMPTLVELPSLEENARLAAALGLKAPPHNSAARRAMSFPPSAA
ncbi:MAG: hypothetical protein Q4E18_09980 [Clostridia bacterium]|nr:hypothetical protein [Clostridia bacterium]